MLRKYNTLVVDQNASILDKINSIITGLNATGKLTNDVVQNWNTVMNWVMNDGLTTDVNNKLDAMVTSGFFSDAILNDVTPFIGTLANLHTAVKDTLVNAINETDDLAVKTSTDIYKMEMFPTQYTYDITGLTLGTFTVPTFNIKFTGNVTV